MNVDPTRAGRIDSIKELFCSTPAVNARKLKVCDLNMDPAALADVDRFGDRLVDPVRLVADMR